MTNREAHEEAAGMALDPLFFVVSGIDPEAEYKMNSRATQELKGRGK
jgi:hypothetical protein